MDRDPIRHYPRSAVVFREGDPADCMYILKEGAVEIKKKVERGEALLKTIRMPNEFFGEMALMDGKPRSATALTTAPTSLMVVDGATFERLLMTNGAFAVKIFKILADRIRKTNLHLGELIDTPPKERIARGVADYAFRHGEKGSGEARYVRNEDMKRWLNGHIGASREEIDAVVYRLLDSKALSFHSRDDSCIIVSGDFMRSNDRRSEDLVVSR